MKVRVLSSGTFMVDSWLCCPMIALGMEYVFCVAHVWLDIRVEKLCNWSVTFQSICSFGTLGVGWARK